MVLKVEDGKRTEVLFFYGEALTKKVDFAS